MTFLEKLKRLDAEATPGPWRIPGKEIKHDSIYQWGHIVHGDRTLFQYNDNFDGSFDKPLVCLLRNNVPALIELVEAAEGLSHYGNCDIKYGDPCGHCAIISAIEKLKGDV